MESTCRWNPRGWKRSWWKDCITVNVYNTIIDSILANLARRRESYDALVDRFEILTLWLSETSTEVITKAATKLILFYDDDINGDFQNKCCHFKAITELEHTQQIPQMFFLY